MCNAGENCFPAAFRQLGTLNELHLNVCLTTFTLCSDEKAFNYFALSRFLPL